LSDPHSFSFWPPPPDRPTVGRRIENGCTALDADGQVVADATHQIDIGAEVTVFQGAELLPWEADGTGKSLAGHAVLIA
jgi:hypothetical protein